MSAVLGLICAGVERTLELHKQVFSGCRAQVTRQVIHKESSLGWRAFGVKQPFNDHLTGAFSLNRKQDERPKPKASTGGQVVCEMDAKKRLRHSIEKGRIAAELQKRGCG